MKSLICDISKSRDICFCSSSFSLNPFVEVPFSDIDGREGSIFLSEGGTYVDYVDGGSRYAYGEYIPEAEAAPYRAAILKMLGLSEKDLSDRLMALYRKEERAFIRSNDVFTLQDEIAGSFENAFADIIRSTGIKIPASFMVDVKERITGMLGTLMEDVADPITVIDDGLRHESIVENGKLCIDSFLCSTMDYINDKLSADIRENVGQNYGPVYLRMKDDALNAFRSIGAEIETGQPHITEEER